MFSGLATFVQYLLDAIVIVLNSVCLLFPPSPFESVRNSQFDALLGQINYFLPVYEFLAVAQAWLIAVGVYYTVALVARWVKAIE